MHEHYCYGWPTAALSSPDAASNNMDTTPDEVESALAGPYHATVSNPFDGCSG
jgi:hypothetical protein